MKYKVTALTPLLVGDGRELSPIDYMVWKDQVNVLDQPRIFKLLARGPRLEGYLTQLRKATKLDFASWGGFAQNFSQRRIPFEHPDSTAIWNSAPPESLFIPTFASNHRGAYLPASAMKGALRTGLIFTRWSASTIERLASSVESQRLPRRSVDIAESNAAASQVKIIAPADSDPVPPASFKIYLSRVASLDTRQPGAPQLVWKVAGRGSVPAHRASEATPFFSEMAAPGVTFEGRWDERAFFENPEFNRALGWRSTPEPKTIIDAANQQAAAQLDLHARYSEISKLPALQQAIQQLQNELTSVRSLPFACLLSIGAGGGFLSKSAFLDTANESYRNLLRSVPAFGRALREGAPFPKTRRIIFAGGQPSTIPGWVRVEFG